MRLLSRVLAVSSSNINGNLFNLYTNSIWLPCTRSVSVIPTKRNMKEDKYAKRDKVPTDFKLIYRAPMEAYIKLSKYVSTCSAAVVGSLAALKFATDSKYIELVDEVDLGGLVAHGSDLWIFATGFIAINTAIMLCVTKLPLRIYKNDKRYLAVFEGYLPLSTPHLYFNKGEVKESRHSLNPWKFITYKIGDKTSFLFTDFFKTPWEFNEMCGTNKDD